MPHIDRRRICFYTSMFKGRSSAQEIAECAVKKGVGAVELMNFSDEFKTPSLSEAKRIGKYARENSLSLPCFSVAVDFLVEEKRRDSLDYLKAYADLAAYLEIPYLHHTLITCFDPTGLTRPVDELMPMAVDVALEIAEYSHKLGIKTLVEDQGMVVNGSENYTLFLTAMSAKNGLLLDTGNIEFVDEHAEDFVLPLTDYVKHVHIKDYLFSDKPFDAPCYRTRGGRYLAACEFGAGDVNLQKTVAILEDSGYSGFYSIEFEEAPTDAALDRILARLESAFTASE